jgi:hypothetical protein
MQITLRFDLKVDQAVARNLIQHVIEKGDTGRQTTLTASIEVQADRDPGFQGISADFGLPHESPMTIDVKLARGRASQTRRETLPRPMPAAGQIKPDGA